MNGPLENLGEWEDFVKSRYNPDRKQEEFRNHTGTAPPRVVEFYRLNHQNQTRDFVLAKKQQFLSKQRARMGIWEAMEFLNDLVP